MASAEYRVGSGSCQPLPASRNWARSLIVWGAVKVVGEAVGRHGEVELHAGDELEDERLGPRGEQPRRQLFPGHQQQAVGGAGVALHEGQAVAGHQEVEGDLARVAQLGHDRLDQLQRPGGVDRLKLDAGAVLALPGMRYIRWEVTRPPWAVL
jgi:hypothetical protein